jgi:hypothetical protein
MPARREVREDACEKGGEREKGKDGRENKVAVYASAGCFFLPPTCVELVSIGGSWVYSPDFLVCRVGNEDARGLRIQHFLCYRLRHKYCIPDMFRGVRIEFHWKTIYSSRRGEKRISASTRRTPDVPRGEYFWDLCLEFERVVRHLRALKHLGHHEEHRFHELSLML